MLAGLVEDRPSASTTSRSTIAGLVEERRSVCATSTSMVAGNAEGRPSASTTGRSTSARTARVKRKGIRMFRRTWKTAGGLTRQRRGRETLQPAVRVGCSFKALSMHC